MLTEQAYISELRIVGIICPVSWDKKGNITDIIIAADGEEEFYMYDSPKKNMLLCLAGFKIELICSIDSEFPNYIDDIKQIIF